MRSLRRLAPHLSAGDADALEQKLVSVILLSGDVVP